MAVTVRSFALPSIDTQMVDPETGELSTPWFNFFLGLYNRTGGTQGSKGNSTAFLFPTGTGTTGQVLTSQGASPTIWTDTVNTASFATKTDLQNLNTPAVTISNGPEQGAIAVNKTLIFWGEFNIATNLTGDPSVHTPVAVTVTVPGNGIKRLMDISVTPYWNPATNPGYQLPGGGYGLTVFNYGYDLTSGLYVGRSDGATTKFDVFSPLPGIHRYRGSAELN